MLVWPRYIKPLIKQIISITDLLSVLPKLVKLQCELDGLWEADMDSNQFVNRVLDVFSQESAIFCEEHGEGFKYVAVLHKDKDALWYFWLFYMNPQFRDYTKTVIAELATFCHTKKIKTLRFSTTRTTRSYERWVSKFGATKQAIVYQLEIT